MISHSINRSRRFAHCLLFIKHDSVSFSSAHLLNRNDDLRCGTITKRKRHKIICESDSAGAMRFGTFIFLILFDLITAFCAPSKFTFVNIYPKNYLQLVQLHDISLFDMSGKCDARAPVCVQFVSSDGD